MCAHGHVHKHTHTPTAPLAATPSRSLKPYELIKCSLEAPLLHNSSLPGRKVSLFPLLTSHSPFSSLPFVLLQMMTASLNAGWEYPGLGGS